MTKKEKNRNKEQMVQVENKQKFGKPKATSISNYILRK